MKILHLISGRDTGGARTHILRLLQELNRTDEVRLLTLKDGPLTEDARALGIPCTAVEGSFFRAVRTVRSAVRREGFTVLHCHGSRANLTGAFLKRTLRVRVISTVHSDHRLDYLRRPLARLVYGTLNAASLRHMDALVCVSDAMKDTYRARGWKEDRLFSIYNGTDTAKTPVTVDRQAWFRAHGAALGEGALVVGTAARLDAVKDIPTLLRGFAAAAEDCPALCLAIAGTGAEEERLRRLAETLKVSQKVFFLGWVEDMEGFFASLDIHALTSRSETFPFVLTDGARYALPTVSTAVGGIPALIEPGKTGLLIPPGDAAALKNALVSLAEDSALRRTLGEALREYTEAHYSLFSMAEAQRACYRRLAARRVAVLGAYGMDNLGDEVMLETILRTLRETDDTASVTVLSRAPRKTAVRFGVSARSSLRVVGAGRFLRDTDVFLCGGGNLLQDATSRRSLWLYCAWLKKARAKGCRVLLYGAGMGPLSERGWKKAADTVENCADAAVLREPESLDALRVHGVKTPELFVGTDLALSTEPAAFEPAAWGLKSDTEYLAVTLRRWRGKTAAALTAAQELADFAAKKGMTPLFLTLCRTDAPLQERAAAAVGARTLDISSASGADAAGLLSGMALIVSMRLHAPVLALRTGTPCAGLDGDGRIAAFCRSAALPFAAVGEDAGVLAETALRQALTAECRERAAEILKMTEIGKNLLKREIEYHG